jgi:NDP-sugar pyrophosphorylase family protein
MQIVIPMSGTGERFRRAGYAIPKFLIKVEGKPIIEHVIDMFPEESKFIFVCSNAHLNDASIDLRNRLKSKCPHSKVIGIEPHKLGPVHAVLQAADHIDFDEPVIVNYCDFNCYWNYQEFKELVSTSGCDGAIAVYSGFHPHMLNSVNFAYVKKSEARNVVDIQEKKSFTDSPMNEYASSGTYYFKSGRLMLEFAKKSMRPDLMLNGEYYISLVYKPMLEDGLKVLTFEIEHFMQWGTPEDLEEYNYFSSMFRLLSGPLSPAQHEGSIVIPMAGLGSRFVIENYRHPKPLVPVSNKAMAVQAANFLPHAAKYIFVLRHDLDGINEIVDSLNSEFSNVDIVLLDNITEGQAITVLAAFDQVDPELPLTVGPCDSGVIYDASVFRKLLDDDEVDVIVWTARAYPGAITNPSMYGWVDATNAGNIRGVSVKKALNDPADDPVVTGIFTFKKAEMFRAATELMVKKGRKINGEYYIDSSINDAIELGLRVKLFDVQSFLCWGTPNELRRFKYWQTCFNKWASHPYSEAKDPMFLGITSSCKS